MYAARLVTTALLCTSLATAQWVQLPTINTIGANRGLMMAGGPGGAVFQFGGWRGNPGALSNLTWSYAGSDWYPVNTANAPSARYEGTLVYDANSSVYLLYGGWTSPLSVGTANNETWQFNGTTWTQLSPATSPGGRWKHGACFDTARNRMVLFGGAPSGLVGASNQTWEFNGTTWLQVATTGNPGPRENFAIAYHAALGRTVLFGGVDPLTGLSNQTWLYNGATSTWTQVVGGGPSARSGAAMVYDSGRARCVMVGGVDANGTTLAETWEFDGASWQQQIGTTAPARDFGLAYDQARQKVVRYGGQGNVGETWRYGAYTDGVGVSCVGSTGQATHSGSPARIGQGYQVFFFNMPAPAVAVLAISLTVIPGGAPLDSIGMTGCLGYVTPDLLFTVAGTGSSANWFGALPQDPLLLGSTFYSQGIVLDPGFNPAWLVSTNALSILVGY